MTGSKLTLQALMRNDLTGQADDHGLARIKKESLFRLRRERTPIKQAATYVWTWFRRQAVFLLICGYLCKSACPVAPVNLFAFGGWYWGVPKIFKQQLEHFKIMTIIYLINHSTSKLFNEV